MQIPFATVYMLFTFLTVFSTNKYNLLPLDVLLSTVWCKVSAKSENLVLVRKIIKNYASPETIPGVFKVHFYLTTFFAIA